MTDKKHLEHRHEGNSSDGSGGGLEASNLSTLHAQGKSFLSAGDEAIRAALSDNSETFLRENRQRGGE